MIILILFFFIASFLVINVVDFTSGNKKQTESASTINKDSSKKKATQKEKLELTQDVVDLEIGAVFDFTQYIKTAEDKYGYSIKDKIKINGKIPTNKEGQYQVDYILDLGDGKKLNKILKVNIKSFN